MARGAEERRCLLVPGEAVVTDRRRFHVSPADVDHVVAMRALLVDEARAGTTITYGEVVRSLHLPVPPKALGRLLVLLSEDCERRGEPTLAALVVQQSTGEVGDGYGPQASDDRRELIEFWRGRQRGRPTRSRMGTHVLGIDAAGTVASTRKGWLGVSLSDDAVRGVYGATVAEVVAQAERDGPLDCIAIDMPIGLPDAGGRRADVEASSRVGRRSSSVFPVPIRAAMTAPTQAEADAISRRLVGKGVGSTAFSLARRIAEVEEFVLSRRDLIVEVHPEVSFATLKGQTLRHSKHNWSGFSERSDLLRGAGLLPATGFGEAGDHASVDDVLDACICAWTARRVARGEAFCLPDPPEVFSDGLSAAIWV